MTDQQQFQLVTVCISAGAGLLGVLVGGAIGIINGYIQRKREGVRQRLEHFYGPMLAIRSRIKAKSELRLELSRIAGEEWPKLFASARQMGDPEASMKTERERWPQFERIIEDADKDLGQEIIPAYKQMVDLFVTNMYLANEQTRSFFPKLAQHVEILELHYNAPLPREIAIRLDHTEQKLYPFYEELEKQFRDLQRRLD